MDMADDFTYNYWNSNNRSQSIPNEILLEERYNRKLNNGFNVYLIVKKDQWQKYVDISGGKQSNNNQSAGDQTESKYTTMDGQSRYNRTFVEWNGNNTVTITFKKTGFLGKIDTIHTISIPLAERKNFTNRELYVYWCDSPIGFYDNIDLRVKEEDLIFY
ncbi:hypothetical protein DICPUDRAFT_91261 [Dictyostelium purpureum]|uniref:Uncharacterized protein n=1 Tax=Dictyostelium purpureum TaxID=5786 RepID=F0ZA05_DICPU|nr:uncharacterized protein DICPUDRAFT_91261 [Dictyostelium purpureum]EGC39207.1 hypothetical protein DICPUDRAFT_91261 [Dictyostelium purpureum]|eukprot:XP_003284234.1 hypothetical protein DICPUDRAFT_91261 [Dictyostelium purpureum]